MEWTNCDSTNIARYAYDSSSEILYVEFHHGGVYQYFDVPERIYTEFSSASSKGQFLASNVKGHFRYARM